jgi:hypothetical protein
MILRTKIKGILMALLIIFLIPLVLGHFLCGEVKDSFDNVSASWFDVRIYYPDDRNNFGTCKVSPAGNKYCCDVETIKNKTWKVGDIIYSEIYDNDSGFIAGPVSIVTSGEGFDVMPIMKLEKVISISNLKKIIVTDNTYQKISIRSIDPFNNIQINNFSCIDCNSFENDIQLNYGINNIEIMSESKDRAIKQDYSLALVKDIKLERKFICPKCSNDKIKNKQIVTVNVQLKSSDYIEDLTYQEYVPIDFKIIESNGGEIKPFSYSHNIIFWKIKGKDINISYKIISPNVQIFARSYSFFSNLENILFPEKKVNVYRFINFFPVNVKVFFNDTTKTLFSKSTNNNPMVLYPNLSLVKLAIFPNKEVSDIEVGLINDVYLRDINNALNYYFLDTNLKLDSIDKIYLELQIKKNELLNQGYNNVSFYYLDNDSWKEFSLNLSDDREYYFYHGYIPSTKGIAIAGEKNLGIIDLIINSMK